MNQRNEMAVDSRQLRLAGPHEPHHPQLRPARRTQGRAVGSSPRFPRRASGRLISFIIIISALLNGRLEAVISEKHDAVLEGLYSASLHVLREPGHRRLVLSAIFGEGAVAFVAFADAHGRAAHGF